MERSDLSWMFYLACDRIHEVIDDLYEAIHTSDGDAVESMLDVHESVRDSKARIYEELDLIKCAIDEYSEATKVQVQQNNGEGS